MAGDGYSSMIHAADYYCTEIGQQKEGLLEAPSVVLHTVFCAASFLLCSKLILHDEFQAFLPCASFDSSRRGNLKWTSKSWAWHAATNPKKLKQCVQYSRSLLQTDHEAFNGSSCKVGPKVGQSLHSRTTV